MKKQELIQRLSDVMGEFVEAFVTPITLIGVDDRREPPGDHHGTGTFVDVGGVPHLLTCEHVAKPRARTVFGYSCFGAEFGRSMNSEFDLSPYPVDAALASLEGSWRTFQHDARCVPTTLFAGSHESVEREYFYLYGFPGEESHASFCLHHHQGVGVITHEVPYDPLLADESPQPLEERHIFLGFRPADASLVSGPGSQSLPLAPGMSGSLVWNTRYEEVTRAGQEWTPKDARITAIVWGASTKVGVLVATPIQYVRSALPWFST